MIKKIDNQKWPVELKIAVNDYAVAQNIGLHASFSEDAPIDVLINLINDVIINHRNCDGCERHEPGSDCYEHVYANPPERGP